MSAVEIMNVPEGGLASFLTSNLDEIEDRVLAFGRKAGLNSFDDVAQRMARFGREGDDRMIHAKTGELVVSPEILEENPELAQQLADSFANSDVDMNRYIVGNENNSLNPMTGQPEFFLKKIVKGVKNFVKGAVNVVKKIAPVILPFAINMIAPGLGSIGSGALGAGLGSLIQGKSFKDSMKAALVGGAMGGLSAGISGVMNNQGFWEGVKSGLPDFMGYSATPLPGVNQANALKDRISAKLGGGASGLPPEQASGGQFLGDAVSGVQDAYGSAKNYLMPNASELQAANYQKALKAIPKGINLTDAQKLEMFKAAAPGVVQQYGKLALAGTGAAAALGAFDPIPAEPIDIDGFDPSDTAEKRVSDSPEEYRVGIPTNPPEYVTLEDVMVGSSQAPQYYIPPPMAPGLPPAFALPQLQLPTLAAQGGEMVTNRQGMRNQALDAAGFPRRSGYISGPGTETSDDVPAMLSDGEFVMTARAVRGLGNGSREQGVRKMYDMMRAFEGGVVS